MQGWGQAGARADNDDVPSPSVAIPARTAIAAYLLQGSFIAEARARPEAVRVASLDPLAHWEVAEGLNFKSQSQ